MATFFDEYEQQAETERNESEDGNEEGEERGDRERLAKIKGLLFDVHKQNTEMLRVDEYARLFSEVCSQNEGARFSEIYF